MSALALRTRSVSCARPRSVGRAVVVPRPVNRRISIVARAEGQDFDALLATFADKFEKVENKPVVVGYIAAAVSALIFAEWLVHLPALDIILGFPLQLVGILLTPILAVRYLVDGKDVVTDVVDTFNDVAKKLPGLDK